MNIDSYMAKTKNAELILACGGRSVRMGQNKLLMDICGKPCILRTCEVFDYSGYIKRIIIAAPPELHDVYRKTLEGIKTPIVFVSGGDTRQQSIMKAVKQAKEDIIVIHDGARPLITTSVIERSVEDAFSFGSSIVCVPSKDTIRLDDGESSYSPPRSNAYIVQTPQSFSRLLYLKACESVTGDYTDDAQLLDAVGIKPHITTGEYSNIKITNIPEDAYRYVVNGKSPIEWIMERYQVKTDEKSNILNNPNLWCKENSDPKYIYNLLLSVITLSISTSKIVSELPDITTELS